MNGETVEKHINCLKEVLTDYLEGTLDPVVKSACEVHLIACDPCRQNLALFMRVLREEVSPEEEANLQQLSALWEQRNLRPVPAQRRWPISAKHLMRPAMAIAAILLLVVGLGWYLLKPGPSEVTRIATAMVSRLRPFESRVAGQPYLRVQEVTRGPEEAGGDLLTEELTEKSAESYEVGLYFLMNRDYPTAIKHLKKAVADSKGVLADVHNDLGVAYLENKNYAAAETEFKEALHRKPSHTPAVFNLSILYERVRRRDEAMKQWQQYLRLDSDSGWAKEIEEKLSRKEPAEQ